MDILKSIFEKAMAEGLVPFMMMQTNGSKSKRNTIRIIEIALFIIPIIYFGGKIVKTLETVSDTQRMMQVEMKEMKRDDVNLMVEVGKISTRLEGHLDYESPRRYNAEEEDE